MFNNSCSNVRAVISVSATDEIRDMASNYSIPTNRKIRGINGAFLGDGWDNVTGGASGTAHLMHPPGAGIPELFRWENRGSYVWTATELTGSLSTDNCVGWTDGTSSEEGKAGDPGSDPYYDGSLKYLTYSSTRCDLPNRLLCVCY